MDEVKNSNSFFDTLVKPFLNKISLRTDSIAGITVGLVMVPQSLAYAQLAGLPPHYGLYAALLPTVIASLFGSSPQLSTGPIAVLSVLALSTISPFYTPGSPEFISNVLLLAFLLGFFQLILGACKLGGLVSFLSHPVTYAFTNATAIVIAATQLSNFLGVTVQNQARNYQTVMLILTKARYSLDWHTVIIGFLAITWMIVLKKINKNIPYILITIVALTAFVAVFHYPVATLGSIPRGLPALSFPEFHSPILKELLVPTIVMSLIGFTQSISIAQAIAIKTKKRLDPNKELIGQGLANIVSSFTLGSPVGGSFPRTALSYQLGTKSWLSSLFTSLVVLVTLLFLTPLLSLLPKVILAAIIILSVTSLIDVQKLKSIMAVSKFDGFTAIITFIATLYFAPDLQNGLIIGVLLSVIHFVFKNTHPRIAFLSRYKDGSFHDSRLFHLDQCENIAVVRLDAPLFFANATFFENEIIKYLANHQHISHVLFVANGINDIDATGAQLLYSFTETLTNAKKKMYFSVVKAHIYEILEKTELVKLIGEKHFFSTTQKAVDYLLKNLNRSEKHIDKNNCPLTKYIELPVESMQTMKTRRESIADAYQRLFHKVSPALAKSS